MNQVTPVTDSITASALRKRAQSHLDRHTTVLKAEQPDTIDEKQFTHLLVGQIHLSDDGKMLRVPLIRQGKFDHPWYGELDYDDKYMQSLVDNFYGFVVGTDLTLTDGHRSMFNPNPDVLGWWREVELDDGGQLTVFAEPTERGLELIPSERRYASAELEDNYVDSETQEEFGPTLVGGAATNHPFVHRQGAITVLSDEVTLWTEQDDRPIVLLQSSQPIYVGGPNMPEKIEEAPQGTTTITTTNAVVLSAEDIEAGEFIQEYPLREIELQTEAGESIVLTAEQVQKLLSDNIKLTEAQHRTNVDTVLRKAEEKGVAPAVLNLAKPILMACSEEAEATIELGDDQMNYFGAIARLLDVIPGVLGEPSQDVIEVPNPVQGEKLTLEQAEEKAKRRRAELAPKLGRPSSTAEV